MGIVILVTIFTVYCSTGLVANILKIDEYGLMDVEKLLADGPLLCIFAEVWKLCFDCSCVTVFG